MSKVNIVIKSFLLILFLNNCSTMNESNLQNFDMYDTPDVNTDSDLSVLTIKTEPEDAEIYVNNRLRGSGSVIIEDTLPGVYKIEIEKDGYKKLTSWITYNGGEETFFFELERLTGLFTITTEPQDVEIILGGVHINQGTTTVPVGTYLLDIKSFGYEKSEHRVTILEDETTEINEKLIKASFRIENFDLSRSVLNPDNPGLLGSIDINFEVFSYGSGSLNIIDDSGTEVFSKDFDRFTSWEQTVVWTGESDSGTKVEDGNYLIELNLTDEETGKMYNLSKPVQIDRDLKINFKNGWNGNSGLIFASLPGVLPKKNIQLSTHFFGHFDKIDNFLVYQAPMCLLFRFGLGRNLELNINVSIILTDTDELPYLFSSSMRYHYLKLSSRVNFNSAVTGKISFQNRTGEDTFTNFTGITIGNPLELKTGPVSFVIVPEITVSMWKITHDDNFNKDPGFYSWFYTRAGILADFGFLTTGLSFAARTRPFSADFGFDLPVHTAFEINFLIPGTKLFLSACTIAEFGGEQSFYIFGGGGLGYIN